MKQIPQLHAEITGSGPVVVLLHGYLASSRYWDKVIADLSRNHTVVAIDLLGFGQSPKPKRSRYDLDAQTRSIDATLEAIGITRPFTLIGHSMGSLVSLHYANKHPEQLRKLLLTNMPIFASPAEAKQDIYQTRRFYRLALLPILHGLIWGVLKMAFKLHLARKRISGNVRAPRDYFFQSTSISRLRSLRNIIFAAKVETDLLALEVSTVIISGLSDRAAYLRNLGGYRLGSNVAIKNVQGGHHLPLTSPNIFRALV